MPQFRKKPVVITAEQYFAGQPLPEGVEMTSVLPHEHPQGALNAFKPVIRTLEGVMDVSDGDYVITGVKGEKYPCKPDIFEQTYEAV